MRGRSRRQQPSAQQDAINLRWQRAQLVKRIDEMDRVASKILARPHHDLVVYLGESADSQECAERLNAALTGKTKTVPLDTREGHERIAARVVTDAVRRTRNLIARDDWQGALDAWRQLEYNMLDVLRREGLPSLLDRVPPPQFEPSGFLLAPFRQGRRPGTLDPLATVLAEILKQDPWAPAKAIIQRLKDRARSRDPVVREVRRDAVIWIDRAGNRKRTSLSSLEHGRLPRLRKLLRRPGRPLSPTP